MNEVKNMADLELSDFDRYQMWQTVSDEMHQSRDECVRPMPGKSSVCDGETDLWVRFTGTLADGTPVEGAALAESPPPDLLLWSFWVNGKWLVLLLPPAPAFVLKKTGPIPFAAGIGKPMDRVFPTRIRSEVSAESTGRIIIKEIRPQKRWPTTRRNILLTLAGSQMLNATVGPRE
jgi:hypothetical protein